MKSYVLGFAFDIPASEAALGNHGNVVLIHKIRPAWQNGYLNGIGGKVENRDSDIHSAMSREFSEETGLRVAPEEWSHYATMRDRSHRDDDWIVYVFKAFGIPVWDVTTTTDELVEVVRVSELPLNIIFNLRWLIPLAMDSQPQHTDAAYMVF
jgi:8-oxo-dGTP diphosphatase